MEIKTINGNEKMSERANQLIVMIMHLSLKRL